MHWEQLIFLILSVLLGASIPFFIKKKNKKFINFLTTFSGSFLLGLAVLHFLPTIYSSNFEHIGFYILIGFVLQLVLDYFSKGIEHGHFHHVKKSFPFGIYISLCIHALLEGIPLDINHHDHHIGEALLGGVLIHKLPVAIVLSSLLLESQTKKITFWLAIFGFAIMAPLGSIFPHFFEGVFENHQALFPISLSLIMGMFIHISTTILFESTENHQFNFPKFISIIIGFIAAITLF